MCYTSENYSNFWIIYNAGFSVCAQKRLVHERQFTRAPLPARVIALNFVAARAVKGSCIRNTSITKNRISSSGNSSHVSFAMEQDKAKIKWWHVLVLQLWQQSSWLLIFAAARAVKGSCIWSTSITRNRISSGRNGSHVSFAIDQDKTKIE